MVAAKEKFNLLEKPNEEHGIHVSHITIRQSISFLLIRLVTLEIVSVLGLILSLVFFFNDQVQDRLGDLILFINIPFFALVVLVKTIVMLFIVIQWLNEYYEITPKYIVHKRGFLFKKEERNTLMHLGKVSLEQNLLGRLLNYGNVKVFNWALEKEITLYLIHNPMKTIRVLQDLLPEADEENKTIREHLIEEDKE